MKFQAYNQTARVTNEIQSISVPLPWRCDIDLQITLEGSHAGRDRVDK